MLADPEEEVWQSLRPGPASRFRRKKSMEEKAQARSSRDLQDGGPEHIYKLYLFSLTYCRPGRTRLSIKTFYWFILLFFAFYYQVYPSADQRFRLSDLCSPDRFRADTGLVLWRFRKFRHRSRTGRARLAGRIKVHLLS